MNHVVQELLATADGRRSIALDLAAAHMSDPLDGFWKLRVGPYADCINTLMDLIRVETHDADTVISILDDLSAALYYGDGITKYEVRPLMESCPRLAEAFARFHRISVAKASNIGPTSLIQLVQMTSVFEKEAADNAAASPIGIASWQRHGASIQRVFAAMQKLERAMQFAAVQMQIVASAKGRH